MTLQELMQLIGNQTNQGGGSFGNRPTGQFPTNPFPGSQGGNRPQGIGIGSGMGTGNTGGGSMGK